MDIAYYRYDSRHFLSFHSSYFIYFTVHLLILTRTVFYVKIFLVWLYMFTLPVDKLYYFHIYPHLFRSAPHWSSTFHLRGSSKKKLSFIQSFIHSRITSRLSDVPKPNTNSHNVLLPLNIFILVIFGRLYAT